MVGGREQISGMLTYDFLLWPLFEKGIASSEGGIENHIHLVVSLINFGQSGSTRRLGHGQNRGRRDRSWTGWFT